MNYEVDAYVEAQRKLPSRDVVLQTRDCDYYHFKTDIFAGLMTYSTDKNHAVNLVTIPRERVFEIIEMNRKGNKPNKLTSGSDKSEKETSTYSGGDILEDQSITRFDNKKKQSKNRKFRKNRSDNPQNSQENRNPRKNNNERKDKNEKSEN